MRNKFIFVLFLIPSAFVTAFTLYFHKKLPEESEKLSTAAVILEELKTRKLESKTNRIKAESPYRSFDNILKECGIQKYSFYSGKQQGIGSYSFECDSSTLNFVLSCLNKSFLSFFPETFVIEKRNSKYSVSAEFTEREKNFKVSEKTVFFNIAGQKESRSYRCNNHPVPVTVPAMAEKKESQKKTYSIVGSVFSEEDFIYIKCIETGALKKVKKEKFNFKEYTYDEND